MPSTAEGPREAIVSAALELFARQGYPRTSVQEIADVAGYTKGTVYYYFDTKEDILLLIHDEYMDVVLAEVERIRQADGPPLEKLAGVIQASVNLLDDYLSHMKIFLSDWRFLSPAGRAKTREKRRAFERFVIEILNEGAENGSINGEFNNEVVARGIVGMCSWPYLWYRKGSITTEQIGDLYANVLTNGLHSAG